MNNSSFRSFFTELSNIDNLNKNLTSFNYENNKYDVYSKISDNKFYFFKIIDDKVVINGKSYALQINNELIGVIKSEAKIKFDSLLNKLSVANLVLYDEIFIIDKKQSKDSWRGDEYADFEKADYYFSQGNNTSDYNSAVAYYLQGFLHGIHYRQGLDIAFESIAKIALENGAYDTAANFFEKGLQSDQGNNRVSLHYHLGECYFNLKEYKKAIEHLNQSIAIYKTPDARYLRAKSYIEINELESAKTELRDIIKNTRKDYGLSVGDKLKKNKNWQTFQQYGEVLIIHDSKILLSRVESN